MKKRKLVALLVISLVAIGLIIFILITSLGKDNNGDRKRPKSTEKISATPSTEASESKPQLGEIVKFGRYEQDGNTENGLEDIEWVILDIKGKELLIISKNAIECMPFHNTSGGITWEKSSVREWLNKTFFELAFDDTEREFIKEKTIEDKDYYLGIDKEGRLKAQNSEEGLEEVAYHTVGGNTTTDKVFLLSVDEANEYFSTSENRALVFTSAAREQFLSYCIEDAKAYGMTDEKIIRENVEKWEQEHGTGSCYWWLRNPGMSASYCSVVDNDGATTNSQNADNKEGGVRPAMWVILPEE